MLKVIEAAPKTYPRNRFIHQRPFDRVNVWWQKKKIDTLLKWNKPALYALGRVGPLSCEWILLKNSKRLAIDEFNFASTYVRGYRNFLQREYGANWQETINDFASIPTTSKDNYIKSVGHPGEIYVGGEIPRGSKRDTSTGTSGKPTSWHRGPLELEQTYKQISLVSHINCS